MTARGFLRSNGNTYSLSPKITTIGAGQQCDFIIQNNTVESNHAVIEYLESENCFLLRDMNTDYGTYINECRIQTVPSRLSEGSILKFGLSKETYEFLVQYDENPAPYQISEITKRSLLKYPKPSQHQLNNEMAAGLPVIYNTLPQSFHQKPLVPDFSSRINFPRTPSSSSRNGRPPGEGGQTVPNNVPSLSNISPIHKREIGPVSTMQSLPDSKFQSLEDTIDVERLKALENKFKKLAKEIDLFVQDNKDLIIMFDGGNGEMVLKQVRELNEEVTKKSNKVQQLQTIIEKSSENQHSNTPGRTFDAAFQRQEIEKLRKDLQTSNRLVTSLQKDLYDRDSTIKNLNKDNEHLKKNITEKDITVSSLMRNLSRLKEVQEEELDKLDRNEELIDLQNKITAAEKIVEGKEQQIEHLNKLTEQLQRSEKINIDTARDLTVRLLESKTLVGTLQLSEGMLKVNAQEIENKYTKLRSLVMQVSALLPKSKEGVITQDDVVLTEYIKEFITKKNEDDKKVGEMEKVCEEEIRVRRQLLDNIEQLTVQMKDSLECLAPKGRSVSGSHETLNILESAPCDESLQTFKRIIIDYLRGEIDDRSSIEANLAKVESDLSDLSLLESMERFVERHIGVVESKSKVEQQLKLLAEIHDANLERLRKEHEEDISLKVSEVISKERSQIEAELKHTLARSMEAEQERKTEESKVEIERLRLAASEKEVEFETLAKQLNEFDELKRHLDIAIQSKQESEQRKQEEIDRINEQWKLEIHEVKEDAAKHIPTINSLNEQLEQSKRSCKDLQNQLNKILSDKSKRDAKKLSRTEDDSKGNVADLEKTISTLRDENICLKNTIRDIPGTLGFQKLIRSSPDMKDDIKQHQNKGANAAMGSNGNQNSESDNILIKTLNERTTEIEMLNKQLSEERLKVQEKDDKISKMAADLAPVKVNGISEHDVKLSVGLITMGSQCRGDRHNEIIDAQRIALAELRKKVKAMDRTRFQDRNVEEFTQQISKLKKEISELRTTVALKENVPHGARSLEEILHSRNTSRQSNEDKSNKKSDTESQSKEEKEEMQRECKKMAFDLELAKEVHFELKQSFEFSETSYFHLIRELFGALEIDVLKIPESFRGLSFNVKKLLQSEREEICETVIGKILIIKEMVERRDVLLHGYERDLVKLKQAEDLTMTTNMQMEELVQHTRTKEDEVDLLRETLKRTKDMLDLERRVNIDIKQNKFHLPETVLGQTKHDSNFNKHQCVTEDILQKEKEKSKFDKIKRRDYEIRTLKSELWTKDQQLSEATDRLTSLETTLGIRCEGPIIFHDAIE